MTEKNDTGTAEELGLTELSEELTTCISRMRQISDERKEIESKFKETVKELGDDDDAIMAASDKEINELDLLMGEQKRLSEQMSKGKQFLKKF